MSYSPANTTAAAFDAARAAGVATLDASPTVLLVTGDAARGARVRATLAAAPVVPVLLVARDAAEALDRAARELPDVLLLDPDTPGARDATEALRRLGERLSIVLVGPGAHRDEARYGAMDALEDDELTLALLGRAVRHAAALARERAALRESEERFRGVIGGIGEGIVITDLDDRVLFANRRMEEITGFSPTELLGKVAYEMLAPAEERPRFRERIAERVRGASERYRVQHLRRDGSHVWVEIGGSPLRDATGAVVGTIGTVIDVGERHLAEERLRSRDALLRAVTTTTPLAFLVVDDDRVLYFNHRFCELWRLEPLEERLRLGAASHEDVLALALRQVPDPAAFRETLARRLREAGHEPFEDELRLVDGRVLRRVSTEIRDEHGAYVGRSYFFEDVTARRRTEELQHLLADASAALDAAWADPRLALERVARLATERFGDGCAIDLLDEDAADTLQRVVIAQRDPTREALLREQRRRFPIRRDGSYPSAVVARTGVPFLAAEVDEEMVERYTDGPEHTRLLCMIGIRSVMTVPLVARDAILGAMTFTITASPRRFDAADLAAGRELARRTALALENARLYAAAQREVAERRAAERALRASEERFRSMVENASDPIAILGADGRTVYATPAHERVLGYRVDELVGQSAFTLLHPDDRARVERAFTTLVATAGATTSLECRFRHREGSWRTVTMTGRNLLHDPAVRGIVVNSRDVTERQSAERALRASEERYRLVTRATNDVIYDFDVAAETAVWNDAVETVFLHDKIVAQRGDWWPAHIHPDDRDRVLGSLRDALAGQAAVWADEYRFRRGDGRYAHVVDCGYVIRDAAGAPLRIIGAMSDVSARKEAEAALRASEARFRSFVQHAPLGVYRSTREGRLLLANDALARMLGYGSETELLAAPIERLYVDPADRERFFETVDRGLDPLPMETRWRRRDGEVLTVRLTSRVVRDAGGAMLHCDGFVEDVTPLRAAEQALRQAEKLAAVGQLISGVAHELNNPLSAILLFAENLLEEPDVSADALDALAVIREQAQRSRAIVRDLLSTVRTREVQRERVGARELLERAARALRPQVEAAGVTLELVLPADDCLLEVDATAIGQVVTNLVVNGAQAAGEGGLVRLGMRGDGFRCVMTVEDSGPGIAPEVMRHLFEPFFTTKQPGAGTGLGLAMSLAIVRQHGGALMAENRSGEARGARFTVVLPAAAPAPAWAAAPAPEPPRTGSASLGVTPTGAAATRPRRLLVIDDEPAIRTAIRRFFTRRSWEVDEAIDGRAGLEILLAAGAESRYALVICDLRMPGITGVELHDYLAEHRPPLLERLVFSTGDVASSDAAQFVERTRCRVLQKPFELANLARVAAEMADRGEG